MAQEPEPLAIGVDTPYITLMSRAFVKEQDGAEAFEELPEKLISPHRNLVTSSGLAAIEAEVARLTSDYAAAQAAGERAALAALARDLRYWSARLATAELVPPPDNPDEVQFGTRVTLARADGRRQAWRIVGEDEADPARGTLSYVSPLARAMAGKAVGDSIVVAGQSSEIVAIGT